MYYGVNFNKNKKVVEIHHFFYFIIYLYIKIFIMKKIKKYNINETVAEIEKLSKLLKESYVFDEEEYNEVPNDEEVMDDEPIEEAPCCADEKINQIRSLALDGIQDFAKKVNSEEYKIFKAIWMSCDKFYSNQNNEEKI
jgi:hypothetical protein